jgi:tRNA(adenine34) deaminase
MTMTLSDEHARLEHEGWMRLALEQAQLAAAQDEVPIGAILVEAGSAIGRGFNQPICSHDPTAHAEIVALRNASQFKQNYRLPGSTLYVTIEPCTMCLGAIIHARVATLVYGAQEPKAGAVKSRQQLLEEGNFNHRLQVVGGVLAEPAVALMQDFFKTRRQRN